MNGATLCLAAALGVLAACDPGVATQVILRFDADAPAAERARAIRLTFVRPGGATEVVDEPLQGEDARLTFPFDQPLFPQGGDVTRTFNVRAELLDDGGQAFQSVRAIGGFSPGARRYVYLRFETPCEGIVDCGPARTCVAGACEDACVDPVPFDASSPPTRFRACDGGSPEPSGRVPQPVVLYDFDEAQGVTVFDRSATSPALDLTIERPDETQWLAGGLRIDGDAAVTHAGPASKLIQACVNSNEISLEAWIVPSIAEQVGPARIIALSQDPAQANFILGHGDVAEATASGSHYVIRLRTTANTGLPGSQTIRGEPNGGTPTGAAVTVLTHVIYTRDTRGAELWYVDGEAVASSNRPGTLVSWDESFTLSLGNENTGDRAWLGTLHLVAVYDRALSSEEVRQNFNAGAD